MKNLFNNISQEEKNTILEMHSSKQNVISEQPTAPPRQTPQSGGVQVINIENLHIVK
jgi:hypothetical protein